MKLVRLRFRNGRTLFDHRDGRESDVTDLVEALHGDVGRQLAGQREALNVERYLKLAGEGFSPADLETLILDLYTLLNEAADDLVDQFDDVAPPMGDEEGLPDPVADPDIVPYLPADFWERREGFNQLQGHKEAASEFHWSQENQLQDDLHDLERGWYEYQRKVFDDAYRACPLPWVREKLVAYVRDADDMLELL